MKNIYACLVHEKEDCIIDLVRNLHYHDPVSIILLYNGGKDTQLLTGKFPYDLYNVRIVPDPMPMKWGYLHHFALHCMQFALDNIAFDIMTIVDSDQLIIRGGYADYMAASFTRDDKVGMLSSVCGKISREHKSNPVAMQAYSEFNLWKPFLQSFPNGENQFVHWTFWPSTVFTRDAAYALVKIFRENNLLQDIMNRSKIWATEEVIFPTLLRLLGFGIGLNPCSYDFVRHRHKFNKNDLNAALNRKDTFWIHPVERQYEDFIRTNIRQKFNQYQIENNKNLFLNNKNKSMLLILQTIKNSKGIEGWLDEDEADLLIGAVLQVCYELPPPHTIVEIGSYHGKTTVLSASILRAFSPGSKLYSIDTHDGIVGATDQGLRSLPPSFDSFKRNIANAGLTQVVESINEHSFNVQWNLPIGLLFVDGLHDYVNVARDFWHFADYIRDGGYVVFHDYEYYFPGVITFVNELLSLTGYKKIAQVKSMVVIQKKA